jgi:hypothetical protein
MPKKAVLRTAQDIFALDKAFFLIEGHPLKTVPHLPKPGRYGAPIICEGKER